MRFFLFHTEARRHRERGVKAGRSRRECRWGILFSIPPIILLKSTSLIIKLIMVMNIINKGAALLRPATLDLLFIDELGNGK